MSRREIHIPSGPDLTGGAVDEPVRRDPVIDVPAVEPAGEPGGASIDVPAIELADRPANVPAVLPADRPASGPASEPAIGRSGKPASEPAIGQPAAGALVAGGPGGPGASSGSDSSDIPDGPDSFDDPDSFDNPDGSDDAGMDEFQMSILALKDSIGQGRELKERERELKELAEALEADRIELADRENILANYPALAAEQDAIISDRTRQREACKDELSKVTVALERVQGDLDEMRQRHAVELQPVEEELGRARAAADQAKNDERSRKSELNAAESELRRSDDGDANAMAVARHQQVEAAYGEARSRSEQAKARLAQVQETYDEAKRRVEQAQAPLERDLEDFTQRSDSLKQEIDRLGEEISSARNRRQYLDAVQQRPGETAQMRSEVVAAEAAARKMDAENDALRGQLAESKRKARKAKAAIATLAVIVVVFVVVFIVVSGR